MSQSRFGNQSATHAYLRYLTQGAIGKKLVEDAKCEICHNNQTMGDAKAVYLRKDRKVTSFAKLKAQVSVCNTQLNLGLFPEDEEHIAAYLNATYYKFTAK